MGKRKKTGIPSKSKQGIMVGLLILLILGFGGGYIASSYFGGTVDVASLRGGETRPTISPAYFTGKTARSYQIAREIPEVIDSLYCYCRCKENFGHKSLLSCHVDGHSAYCDICQNETIRAYELFQQGKDIPSIRKTIDREFS